MSKKLTNEQKLKILAQLRKSKEAGPPPVDEEAAARVAEAMANMPPVTEEDRKKFLDEFYKGET